MTEQETCDLCHEEGKCKRYSGEDMDYFHLYGNEVQLYGWQDVYICEECYEDRLKENE